jgi:hypothetical protein
MPPEDKKYPLKEIAKAQNKDQLSRIYIKTCENIKQDSHFQLIEDIIVLSPCWSDLRVTIATLSCRTLEHLKRSEK